MPELAAPSVHTYAPYPVVSDAATLGLVETRVAGEHGHTVARHRAVRTSVRATIFLHGAAGAWTTFTPLLQAAAADGIEIENPVLLDLPGWGEGALFPGAVDLSVDSFGAFVKDTAEGLGYTEWDIVGHSLGGSIAMHMAAAYPDQVLSVGMVSGTTFSVIRSIDHPFANFREVPAFVMLWRILQLLSLLGRTGRRIVVGIGATPMARLLFAPLFRHGYRVHRSVTDATVLDLHPRSFAAAATATAGYNAHHWWGRIACPVIALKGDRDIFVTDADFDELARVVPDSRRTVIEDCGHFGIIEHPHAVLAALGYTDQF